jgi:predicted LPLAT superfamily acyltransferase
VEYWILWRSSNRRRAVVFDRDQYRTNEEDAKTSKQQYMGSPSRFTLPPHTTLQ